MDWKDVGSKVLDAAPMIGSLLGGPLGGAAGGLIKVIGSALGLKPDETTPDKIMEVLELDPNAVLKFKELEMANKTQLRKLLLEQDKMYLQDRQDARRRQWESEKATGKRDINLYVLAWLFVVGFFTTIIVMTALALTGKMPESMPQYIVFLLGSLFGTLTSGTGAVIQYFFGSSKGSSDKTSTMADFQRMLVEGQKKT
jgi:hypothetical protein